MEEFSDPLRQQARQQRRMQRLQALSAPPAEAAAPPTDIGRMISSSLGGIGGYSLGGLAAGGLTAASLIPGPVGIGARVARMALPFVGGLVGSAMAPAAVDAVSPSIHSGVNKAFKDAGPYSVPAAAAGIGAMYLLNRGRRGAMKAPNPAVTAGPVSEIAPIVTGSRAYPRLTLAPAATGPGPGVRVGPVRAPAPTDLGPHPESMMEAVVRGHLQHRGPGVLLRSPAKSVVAEAAPPAVAPAMRRLMHRPDTLEFATSPSDVRRMSPAQLLKVRDAENSRMALNQAAIEEARAARTLAAPQRSTGSHPGMIQQGQPVNDAAKIYQAMSQFPDHARGALITSKELRQATGLSKEDFDKAAMLLVKNKVVQPHPHDHASFLTPEELDTLVDTTTGDPSRMDLPYNRRFWVGFAKPRQY